MTHPNESLSPLNGDAGVAQVGEAMAKALNGHSVEQLAAKIVRRYEPDVPPVKQFLREGEDQVLIAYIRELLSRRAASTTGTVKVKAENLLAIRDALLADDLNEAYHQLYMIADPAFCEMEPWRNLEHKASLAAEAEPVATASLPEHAKWCQPGDRQDKQHFLVRFDDPDCRDSVFTDEEEARKFYARATLSWNCWLFGALPAHPSSPVSAEVTDEMAMACDEWPSWLSEAVERTNEFADRADASTEQAVAFGILSILGGGK